MAEGPKVVNDLLHEGFVAETILDDLDDIKKVSFLQHPQPILGVFRMSKEDEKHSNEYSSIFSKHIEGQLVLALDGVQDPGNLGTIIRIADWFGIETSFVRMKQLTVGTQRSFRQQWEVIARVSTPLSNLNELIDHLPADYPIYATLLDGNNIYEQELSRHGMIVMGNEGNGITTQLRARINRKLLIPNYPPERATAESLNVAIATSIVCAEFRRR